jgi:spermidine synthase
VAELVPEVVDWARGPMAALHGDSLSDPRLTLLTADVGAVIAAGDGAWDAILLDVDNGPEGLTRAANDALYGEAGLAAARRALARGGVLAVWSVAPDAGFTARLRRCGFDAEAASVRTGRSRRGARHTVWLARRP